MSRNPPQSGPGFRGGHLNSGGGRATPSRGATIHDNGTVSPMELGPSRSRRVSGGSTTRASPGPGSIYRTMPLPNSGSIPPHHLMKPIPQHVVNSGASPFSPITVPKLSQSPAMSPVPFSPITVQRFSTSMTPSLLISGDFPTTMPSSVNPITADIIASQSQDYVDEGLAEFQEQIQRLQDEQERVQKKTFVNWINSYLQKRAPPLRIESLINDLKDGTKLLALLEVLSGMKLPFEKGRILRRPHFLSNCNTALEFLKSKRIKLVNINASDVVDGRPAVVMGLIWTIILYFQIEENTRVLECLGQRFGTPGLYGSGGYGEDDDRATPGGRRPSSKAQEKWKVGAKKALLQWCQNQVTKKFGIGIRDFGQSWRDGNAFLAIVNSIRPGVEVDTPIYKGVADVDCMSHETNLTRLDTAFYVAEVKLGITRLIDPEDVDVENPDEKSIMTYVAQFLHRYPEGSEGKGSERFETLEAQYGELRAWLTTKIHWFEQSHLAKGQAKLEYNDYQKFCLDFEEKKEIYNRMCQLWHTRSLVGVSPEAWMEIDTNWQKVEAQIRHWRWKLDTSLPGDFGQVGEWLNQGEALCSSDDVPSQLNEEAAAILNQKIEDHRGFFKDLASVQKQFANAIAASQQANVVPEEQLESLKVRLNEIGPKADRRAIKIKFLEHKCCIVAFLTLTETKLKNWTIKYGPEDKVHQIMSQYRTFVSKNKIFQEFQKAYVEFVQVCEEYKANGEICREEIIQIDKFTRDVADRWKKTSTELRCVQSLLEEVLAYWTRWNGIFPELEDYLVNAFEMLKHDEEEQVEFFQDVSSWREKFILLQDTVAFLVATSDASVGQGLRDKLSSLSINWEELFQYVEKYMHVGDVNKIKRDYQTGLQQLDKWLRHAEAVLNTSQAVETEIVRKTLEVFMQLHTEVGQMEDLFKTTSKKFQQLIQELCTEEIEAMMVEIKKEKENLVIIRSIIPSKVQLFHHLVTQLEALDTGEAKVMAWCNEVDACAESMPKTGSLETFNAELNRWKPILAKLVAVQAMSQSVNNVFQSILKTTEDKEAIETSELVGRLDRFNQHYSKSLQTCKNSEARLMLAIKSWENFVTYQKSVECWLKEAKVHLQNNNYPTSESVEAENRFFEESSIETIMTTFTTAAKDLEHILDDSSKIPLGNEIRNYQESWLLTKQIWPQHLQKVSFRYNEGLFNKYLQTVEAQLLNEGQALQHGENVSEITIRHTKFFAESALVDKIEHCLNDMDASSDFCQDHDHTLKESQIVYKTRWEKIKTKVENMFGQLEQIPEQWKLYEEKYSNMSEWMNSVEESLKSVQRELKTFEEFEREKEAFQKLCQDMDKKREDMKWLVQRLDQLVSVRADEGSLDQQKRLELLITRYKSLIPLIDSTMQRIDFNAKCFVYREELKKVMEVIGQIENRSTLNESALADNADAIGDLIEGQTHLIEEQEKLRPNILSLLQRGKDLIKDPHCPGFLKEEVALLEQKWSDCCQLSNSKLGDLKEHSRIWEEYMRQRTYLIKLIDEAETELHKLIPSHSHHQVKESLVAKQQMREEVKRATEDVLTKMKELSETLQTVAASEHQDNLGKEVLDLEEKLTSLLEECDKKIKNLEELHCKWSNFNQGLKDIKGWVGSAKQKLNEILTFDLSPEDRVKMTRELHNQVQSRIKQLEVMEKDIRDLTVGVDEAPEVIELKTEVKSVKEEVSEFQTNVEEQTSHASKDLETWEEYLMLLNELKPWLEEADLKIEMGFGKASSLQDAINMKKQVDDFLHEVNSKKDKLENIQAKAREVINKNLDSEVDVLHSRWQAIKASVSQCQARLQELIESWTTFEGLKDDLSKWIGEQEMLLQHIADPTKSSSKIVARNVDMLRQLCDQTSNKQAILISLTEEGDKVAFHLTPDQGGSLKADITDMKRRIAMISEESRQKLSDLAVMLDNHDLLQSSLKDFQVWLADLESNLDKMREIPVNKLEDSIEKVFLAIQQLADKQPSLDKIGENHDQLADDETIQLTSTIKKFEQIQSLLKSRIAFLKLWLEYWIWQTEAISFLDHLQHSLHSTTFSAKDVEVTTSELTNIRNQCQTRLIEAQDESGLSAKSHLVVVDKGSGTTIQESIQKLLEKICQVEKDIKAKEKGLQNIEAEWDKFKEAEKKLAEWLQVVLRELQKISVRESRIESLKDAASGVEKLSQLCIEKASLKENYERIGKELMMRDPGKAKITQDAISEAKMKWDKVFTLLTEQQTKSHALISMWENCNELRNNLLLQLNISKDMFCSLTEASLHNPKMLTDAADKCRKAIDNLKKVRHPFEMYYKKQTQLIQELQTVPAFDAGPLKQELQDVQQKFSYLGTNLKAKMNSLEAQMVIFRQAEQSADEIFAWLRETTNQMTLSLANLSDIENSKTVYQKYLNELPHHVNLKNGMEAKVGQLTDVSGSPESGSYIDGLVGDVTDAMEETRQLSLELENILFSHNKKSSEVQDKIKEAMNSLSDLREVLMQCDDTSGSDQDLLERLQKSKDIQSLLDDFEVKIEHVEAQVKNLKDCSQSIELNVIIKDFAAMEKKFESVSALGNKVTTCLYGLLEKHYIDHVQAAMKFVSACRNKLLWCIPEPSSDKFNLESKMDTVEELLVEVGQLDEFADKLQASGHIMLIIVDPDKNQEVQETVECLQKSKNELSKEVEDVRSNLEALMEKWSEFEKSQEVAGQSLKKVEEDIRQIATLPFNLSMFQEAQQTIEALTSTLATTQGQINLVEQAATSIIESTPNIIRIDHISSNLKSRYQVAKSGLDTLHEKLQNLLKCKESETGAFRAFREWLTLSRAELKEFENLEQVTDKQTCDATMANLKEAIQRKTVGHKLLETAIDESEKLFSHVSPDDRDNLRQAIKSMRDDWESHIDYMNSIGKRITNMTMCWSSFDESIEQLQKWFEVSEKKLDEQVGFGSIFEKKLAFQNVKGLLQDIDSHAVIVSNLDKEATDLRNERAMEASALCQQRFDKLKQSVQTRIGECEESVTLHEEYNKHVEKMNDLILRSNNELLLTDSLPTTESEDTSKRLEILDRILESEKLGSSILGNLSDLQLKLFESTSMSGRDTLNQELVNLSQEWNDLISRANDFKIKLHSATKSWTNLRREIGELSGWLEDQEAMLKDRDLKRDAKEKQMYLEDLKSVLKELGTKANCLKSVTEKAREAGSDSDISVLIADLNGTFNNVRKNCTDTSNKYEAFVKDHVTFDQQHAEFMQWMRMISEDLPQYSEIKGDLKSLQEKKAGISDLEELRTGESLKYESILELGEKLYIHTSQDGREEVRQQLKKLRDLWESMSLDMARTSALLEKCLQQFSDLTILQDQLTKWLKDIETAMHHHTELRPSLQEKKCQLQSHKQIHQEITSHNSLVEAVCNKAKELVDQTHDSSLNIYIESIRNLFTNIGQKSKDLNDKLQACVNDHNSYSSEVNAFKDFSASQAELLSQCADIAGEKADLELKAQILDELKQNKLEGDKKLHSLDELCSVVCKSTAPKGAHRLRLGLQETKETWATHTLLLDDIEINIEKGLAQWRQFNDDTTKYAAWFKEYEDIFHSQPPYATCEEKEDRLKVFAAKRSDIIDFESNIDDFVNSSNTLFQNSGTERLKTTIMQVNNRYQLLHVLSKDVCARWQGIVEEHQNFDDKVGETKKWLRDLEDTIERAVKEINVEIKSGMLQSIVAEQETAPVKIHAIVALAEHLYPDTSSPGREGIRQELKKLQLRWDTILEKAEAFQKKLDTQLQSWSTYQESLNEANGWLAVVENGIKIDHVNWASVQEVKSKLLKLKTAQQDINSHKRFIELVNEKGAAVVQANPHAAAEEVQGAIETINDSYDELQETVKRNVTLLENVIETIQHHQELKKCFQDWQKDMWDKLSICTDYSGNKVILEKRLAKLTGMGTTVSEGGELLQTITTHIEEMPEEQVVLSKARDTLERDLQSLKFDYEKFQSAFSDVKHNVQSRLNQWSEYEHQHEKLFAWINESEANLKTYNLRASFEEKVQQLERFQDILRVIDSKNKSVTEHMTLAEQLEQSVMVSLRQSEMELDKISDERSDISQLAGDTRISLNVQQITSRFRGVQNAVKEIVKRAENEVATHKQFDEKYQKFSSKLSNLDEEFNKQLGYQLKQDEVLGTVRTMETLLASKPEFVTEMNSLSELCEKLYNSTSQEGRDFIRTQISDIQQEMDLLFDKILQQQRELESELTKWKSFDENSASLLYWVNEMGQQVKSDIVLKAILDEKKAQLQHYRTALQEIKAQKPAFDDLREKFNALPQKPDNLANTVDLLETKYREIFDRLQDHVSKYEGFVSDHLQYTKAVMDTSEWLTATANTIEMWGDTSLERLSLHANLERLKNLQLSLPQEAYRADQIKTLGEKVLPGTVDSGKTNVKIQIDSTSQEWDFIQSSVEATIEALEQKIKQWSEYEAMKEDCLVWLRQIDTRLHMFDLKATLPEKSDQLEELRHIQGQVKAKELEIDALTDKTQYLYKGIQSLRNTYLTELTVKYQNIVIKLKDLVTKWQNYVSVHSDFEIKMNQCEQWIGQTGQKLSQAMEISTIGTQADVDGKVELITDLLMSKEDGFKQIQTTIELAQVVLANTSTDGHGTIQENVDKLQNGWNKVAGQMADCKMSIDDSIKKWAGFLDQLEDLEKALQSIQKGLHEAPCPMSSSSDIRNHIELLKSLEERARTLGLDIESVKMRLEGIGHSPHGHDALQRGKGILECHAKLVNTIQDELAGYENLMKNYKAFKVAQDSLVQYLQRCKDKLQTMKQRSPNDKNYVDAITQGLDHLLNKEAQGQIIVEQLTQAGDILLQGSQNNLNKEKVSNEISLLNTGFLGLFNDVKQQRHQMGQIMNIFRDFKEETERLTDWLQQSNINIKASKTSLLSTLEDKARAVKDMEDLNDKLSNGKRDIERYIEMANKMRNSCLEANVMMQQRDIFSKYQVTCSIGLDIWKKVQAVYQHHLEYQTNVNRARQWMEEAWKTVRKNTVSEGKTKEDLHRQLDNIRDLMSRTEEGQAIVNAAVDWGEKTVRNTRSDGKDKILTTTKELQLDWEKLVKKISGAKVTVETDLLQWSDAQQSVSRLQEWINDREKRLRQAAEHKNVMITRRSTLGISTLSVSERTATLRQTNSILQDIQAFEPMIKTVASATSAEESVTEITTKYENLTKQAQLLYDKEKEMVDKHELFMEAGHEFMSWLRGAKEKLAKCSEPTGDKDSLANKVTQIRILESEKEEGEKKLEESLRTAAEACAIALEEDRDIVEEEVAFLQDEFDQFTEQLGKTKYLLEGGIVRWTEYQDLYHDALTYLEKTEKTVNEYNKYQAHLQGKRKALEDFQRELQGIFDWQNNLDILNRKGQSLLEICADSRVSNGITQLTTKYQAIISLAKDVIRRLEIYFQEHHQHSGLVQDCQSFIDRTRNQLQHAKEAKSTHESVSEKLRAIRDICQSLDQGQNKLRYVVELKERVILNTDKSGCPGIEKETADLKEDFENLILEIQDTRTKLSDQLDLLGNVEKSNKVLLEWIEDTEHKIKNGGNTSTDFFHDLAEKRAALERTKVIQRDLELQETSTLAKLQHNIRQDPKNQDFSKTIDRFLLLKQLIDNNMTIYTNFVHLHETYQKSFNEALEYVRQAKLDLQHSSDHHGDKRVLNDRMQEVKKLVDSFNETEMIVNQVWERTPEVLQTTSDEGKDVIKHDNQQLKYDWEQLKNSAKQALKTIEKCLQAWADFETEHHKMMTWIQDFQKDLEKVSDLNMKTDEGLETLKTLLKRATSQKYEMENLNDKCEVLMEHSACSYVRDLTVNAQAAYGHIYNTIQSMFAKAERSVTDFTDFFKAKEAFEAWYLRSQGTMMDFSSVEAPRDTLVLNLAETRNLIACTTEGQHLLNCINEAFAKVAPASPDDQIAKMREACKDMKSKFDSLNVELTNNAAALHSALQRWSDFEKVVSKIGEWIASKQEAITNLPDSKGDIGEMKTLLERIVSKAKDIEKEKETLENLQKEELELTKYSTNQESAPKVRILQDALQELEVQCQSAREGLQKEIDDYGRYYQQVQVIEKWLLQMSFQLMAHNSLYITTKEQSEQQMIQHDNLISEIHDYQKTIDHAREQGNEQIVKYIESKPSIKEIIEKQHQNIQESYNSLLQTAAQIKNRLMDSIVKFNEYEETLEIISSKLTKWEVAVRNIAEVVSNTERLDRAKELFNMLQAEKAKLIAAIQACEAATACVSRPGSPLTDQEATHTEHELTVKAKADDLIDQVHSIISGCLSKANEIEDIERMKKEMEAWIDNKENEVAKQLQKPSKLRPDAAQLEINLISDFRQTVAEKHGVLEQLDQRLRDAGVQDPSSMEIRIKLDVLDEHIGMLLEKRFRQHTLIEDYKSALHDAHAWIEKTIRMLEDLDSNQSTGSQERASKISQLAIDFESTSEVILSGTKEKADAVCPEIGDLDGQQLTEQVSSIERRINDLRKRIDRKRQVIEMAAANFESTKGEIAAAMAWIKIKSEWLAKVRDDEEENDDFIDILRILANEVETRQLTVDSLQNQIHLGKADLAPKEFSLLVGNVEKLSESQNQFSEKLNELIKQESDGAKKRKKFQEEFDAAQAWIQAKSNEYLSDCMEPYRSHAIELHIAKLKKYEGEMKLFDEEKLSRLKREMLSVIKRESQDQEEKIEDLCKELETASDKVKSDLRGKIASLEKSLELRLDFEHNIERCSQWLNRADSTITSEIRGTVNIATLDQQLHKFKELKKEEDQYRAMLASIVDYGNSIRSSLNDADCLTLQNQLDECCDKMNRISDTTKSKMDDLVTNIQHYRKTAQKIEQSVAHLSCIQQEIRQLNKPIGYRVEDAEDVLTAYEKILADLKEFKTQLEDLHKTTGANVNELKALLKQQEDLILAIENQMVKIKTLINVRHQFMALVTGITGFIISYTEVVKEIERSQSPSEDKVKKYEEALRRIDECDSQLAMACDKGQQIAAEASSQDRNKITEQLQSLKTQIITLKKAIERKKSEHAESAAEFVKVGEELEAILQVLLDGESVAKSRPLLGTGVRDVEMKLRDHESNLVAVVVHQLDRLKGLKDEVEGKRLPSQLRGNIASATALLSSLPAEMEDRKLYLERNKELRLEYDSLVERLNSWIEEAQIKLRTFEAGIDFENLEADLEEHKTYFRQETKLRELLNKIHEVADKIRPSLDGSNSQEKFRHEEEFFNQLVKNTLNSAHSKQAEFEENLKRWKGYRDLYDQVLHMTDNLTSMVVSACKPTTLTSLKSAISRTDSHSKVLREKKSELDTFNDVASSIESLADTVNRHKIHEEQLAINKRIKDALQAMKDQKEKLATIALQWEDFDTKYKSFCSSILTQEQKFASVEMTFSTVVNMQESKSKIQMILKESHGLESRQRDLEILSSNIVEYLGGDASNVKSDIENNITTLKERYQKFLQTIETQISTVTSEISSLESVDKSCREFSDKLAKLQREIGKVDVWSKEQGPVAEDLKKHRSAFDDLMVKVKLTLQETNQKFASNNQRIPTESNQQLSALEILTENVSNELGIKESEFGKAGLVRAEFNQDAEEVQLWLQRSDARIQDRSLAPPIQKDQLSEIACEIPSVCEKLERLHKNGQLIIERTHNYTERDLVQSSCSTLTDQLDQLQSWLQKKKSSVGNAIDAWDNFLELHETVMNWCKEKQIIVDESIDFDTLVVAKTKLQTFNVAVKSIIHASKNIYEMGRELAKITESSNPGDLPGKMTEADHSKSTLECLLNEKYAMLLELVEEWDQCEKKLKLAQSWIHQSRLNLDESAQKERPLRDQLVLREKMLSEIPIQKRKVSMSIEKLHVHFGKGKGSNQGTSPGSDVRAIGEEIDKDLQQLTEQTKERCSTLEACLAQIESYQKDIFNLQQQILQQEQQLRSLSGPSYVAKNRDRAMAEQSACRERLRGLQSKISALNERIKLLNQKGHPDE